MTDKLPQWFRTLREYYAAHAAKIPANAQAIIVRRFAQYDESVMASAVDAYIDENEFFPQVAALLRYVRESGEMSPQRDLILRTIGAAQREYDRAMRGDPADIDVMKNAVNELAMIGWTDTASAYRRKLETIQGAT